MNLNPDQIRANIHRMPMHERVEVLRMLDALELAKEKKAAKEDFLGFARAVWPGFISGRHHRIIADAFNRVASGDLKRLIICLPPRHSKSECGSWLLPAWLLGLDPARKIIQASHTAELAVGFGRKVRNLVDSDKYQTLFPGTELTPDSKAAGRWNTSKAGDYFAIGVGGAVTGRGANVLIIDDPHAEQEAALAEHNPEIYDKAYEWYTSGPRQRLQPGGAIIVIMTRWSKRDLVGRILKESAQRGGDEWEVIEFPAIFEPEGVEGTPGYKPERALWPEFWPLEELRKLRVELPLPKWMAQYQQNPTSDAAAIVKREWWKRWEADKPPPCEFILMSLDTAFEKTNRADYSAFITVGVFYREDEDTGALNTNIILLNAFRDKMEFPELKKVSMEQYVKWQPDGVVIEKKASGAPLIYEMRAAGFPVQEFVPSAGNDKISRLNAVSDLFSSGMVWAPNTYWAEEVIEEVASFPSGDHDDYVDALSQALLRIRRGGFIRAPTDTDEPEYVPVNRGYY